MRLYPYMRGQSDKERVRALASQQHGRVSWAQLRHLGVPKTTPEHWIADGYLTRVLPKVYAVGHVAPSYAADLWAAILYAGPGAMLTHTTGTSWRGLIDHTPRIIEVSTPRDIDSLPGIKVYARRRGLQRQVYKGLPVTSIPQLMLDLAATAEFRLVRNALARLDFLQILDVKALDAVSGSGNRGSKALKEALRIHQPRLARVNGRLEENFLTWCERQRLPLPGVNVWVHGVLVDAYWAEANLVVELDGGPGHSSRAQIRRDRNNEMTLRAHGVRVVRYDWYLVHHEPARVRADIEAQLSVGGPLATNVTKRARA
jgi:Protein of unknown function (DUF559)